MRIPNSIEFVRLACLAACLAMCSPVGAQKDADPTDKRESTTDSAQKKIQIQLSLRSNIYDLPDWSYRASKTSDASQRPIPISTGKDSTLVSVEFDISAEQSWFRNDRSDDLQIGIEILNSKNRLKIDRIEWNERAKIVDANSMRFKLPLGDTVDTVKSTSLRGVVFLEVIDSIDEPQVVRSIILGKQNFVSSLQVQVLEGQTAVLAEEHIEIVPVNALAQDSLLPKRVTRSALAALLVDGYRDISKPNTYDRPPLDGSAVGLCLVPTDRLSAILDSCVYNDEHFMHQRTFNTFRRKFGFTENYGIPTMLPGLYYDCTTSEYILAFKHNEVDTCLEWHLKWRERADDRVLGNGAFISRRHEAIGFAWPLAHPESGVDLPGLRFTGIDTGGEVATTLAIAYGRPATVFNMNPQPQELLRLIQTKETSSSDTERSEIVPGATNNIGHLADFVESFTLSLDNFKIERSSQPLVEAQP